MQEVFKKEKFGERLQQNVERIEGKKFQGQQVYKVTKDIPDLGIKKGDTMYLDGLHGDHIEVFTHNGKPRQILSIDGRPLDSKLTKAVEEGRKFEL